MSMFYSVTEGRAEITLALKEIVVKNLRERGFKGSFPHFRRPLKDRIDLISFQFDKWGGSFAIEISKCPPTGITLRPGKFIPPNKVNSWFTYYKIRLTNGNQRGTDEWFDYSDYYIDDMLCEKLAKEILPLLDYAEKWWEDAPSETFFSANMNKPFS